MTNERIFHVQHLVGLKGAATAAFWEAKKFMDSGMEIELILRERKSKRNNEQNKKLNAMCSDLVDQVEWYGQYLSIDDWRHMFVAAYRKEQQIVQGINGGIVVLGGSSRKLSVAECADVIEMLYAFGAERGVVWSGPDDDMSTSEELSR